MKEIMTQYGQSVIAVMIAVLLFTILSVASTPEKNGLLAQTGQIVSKPDTSLTSSSAEFERYWRLR